MMLNAKIYERLQSAAQHRAMNIETMAAALVDGVLRHGCVSTTISGFNEFSAAQAEGG